jgi:uncharacterized protein YggT (Ycf19 family)
MTEREYYRETDSTPATNQRDVYRETVAGDPGDLAGARDVYQERISRPGGDQVVRSEHVSVPSAATLRAATIGRINQVIYYIFGVLCVLLAIRFVLLLLGASAGSSFVRLIYGLSQPFVLPFQGIFGEPTFDGSVIEWSSLVGIIVYSLVAYGLTRLVELVYAPLRQTDTRDS